MCTCNALARDLQQHGAGEGVAKILKKNKDETRCVTKKSGELNKVRRKAWEYKRHKRTRGKEGKSSQAKWNVSWGRPGNKLYGQRKGLRVDEPCRKVKGTWTRGWKVKAGGNRTDSGGHTWGEGQKDEGVTRIHSPEHKTSHVRK